MTKTGRIAGFFEGLKALFDPPFIVESDAPERDVPDGFDGDIQPLQLSKGKKE